MAKSNEKEVTIYVRQAAVVRIPDENAKKPEKGADSKVHHDIYELKAGYNTVPESVANHWYVKALTKQAVDARRGGKPMPITPAQQAKNAADDKGNAPEPVTFAERTNAEPQKAASEMNDDELRAHVKVVTGRTPRAGASREKMLKMLGAAAELREDGEDDTVNEKVE